MWSKLSLDYLSKTLNTTNNQISVGFNLLQKPLLNLLFVYKTLIPYKNRLLLYDYLQSMIKKKYILKTLGKLLLHLLFWNLVLLFFTYFFVAESKNFSDTMSFSLFLMPITIATTYVSIYKLIPEYLITKRYFLFGII